MSMLLSEWWQGFFTGVMVILTTPLAVLAVLLRSALVRSKTPEERKNGFGENRT